MPTIYVCQAFKKGRRGGLQAEQGIVAPTAAEAIRRAEGLSTRRAGAFAYSVEIDDVSGDAVASPLMLVSFGEVPDVDS